MFLYLFKKIASLRPKAPEEPENKYSNRISSFKVAVYDENERLMYDAEGHGDEWQDHTVISPLYINTYSSAMYHLGEAWIHMIDNQLTEYQAEVIGYETIRKFDQAIQLKFHAVACFSVTYV